MELPISLGAYLMLLSSPDDKDVVAFDEPLASSSKMDVKDDLGRNGELIFDGRGLVNKS